MSAKLIDSFILWVAGHLGQLFGLSQWLWLGVGVLLIVRLRVFRAEPLRAAPARVSGFSVLTLAAVVLLYCGTTILAVAGVTVMGQTGRGGAGSAPATTSAPASAPATEEAASLPAGTSGALGAAPAASQPATQAATQKSRGGYVESTSLVLKEQLLNAFAEAVPALVLIFLARRQVVGGLEGWGLSISKLPRGVGYGVLGFLAAMPLLLVVAQITDFVITHFEQRAEEVHETLQMLSRRPPVWEEAAFIVLAAVVAPVLEEMFFRGCVQTMLIQRRMGFTFAPEVDAGYRPTVGRRWLAIFLTSVFFASVHPWDHFFVILLLAMSLGYLYERTGNMWANMTLHALFNGFSIYFTLVS